MTGEIFPVRDLAELAHAHGAEICVDAAQLAPHVPIDMAALGIDHLALSGHKLYAPFGVGALIARGQRIAAAEPLLHGGGAVARVLDDRVVWCDAPARFEAGTPNVFGAIALGAACQVLGAYGMSVLAAEELTLGALLRERLAGVPGLRVLAQWDGDDVPRVALASFHVPGIEAAEVAGRLAEEHAISVRSGAFCAHPLVRHLRGVARRRRAAAPCARASASAPASTMSRRWRMRCSRSSGRAPGARAARDRSPGSRHRSQACAPRPDAFACSRGAAICSPSDADISAPHQERLRVPAR